ncbi:alpha/beta hydrolase [Caballeronia sp. LZ043]|uniref:alpha/beta fold hydrolase n=1 Tax=Caballeronia sp. LZ043 TaxID=3038569 RepID=UPI002860A4D3|nr:alpha/beta hydrolase [Caballeronia sp. LZ043]MDR5820278.1 alpha/beta hydrolase [Caballeronia sp. LZ043]
MKAVPLARVLSSCLVIAACVGFVPSASAENVSFGPDQLCGLHSARPDQPPAAKQGTVQGRNGPIGYARFGHGRPLLLITGYRATLGEWNAYFLGELAKHRDVIVFDNRGIGASTIVDGRYSPDYSIRDMAADAADVIAGLKLSQVDVVGWSMGGMIAQQLALDARDKVASLTLIATAPPGPDAVPTPPEVLSVLSGGGKDAFARIMGVLFPADAVADASRCFVGDMFAPPGYKGRPVPDAVAVQQDRAMQGWFADHTAAAALRRSPVRTLIIEGADDAVLPDANGRALEQMIPRSRLDVVADAGHALMFQYPLELARHVDAFVGR